MVRELAHEAMQVTSPVTIMLILIVRHSFNLRCGLGWTFTSLKHLGTRLGPSDNDNTDTVVVPQTDSPLLPTKLAELRALY